MLVEMLGSQSGRGESVLRALAAIGPPAVPALTAVLDDPDADRRLAAAQALWGMRKACAPAKAALEKRVEDTDGRVRVIAALALYCTDETRARYALVKVMHAECDYETLLQAVRSLAALVADGCGSFAEARACAVAALNEVQREWAAMHVWEEEMLPEGMPLLEAEERAQALRLALYASEERCDVLKHERREREAAAAERGHWWAR
jgi:hypothetical protein